MDAVDQKLIQLSQRGGFSFYNSETAKGSDRPLLQKTNHSARVQPDETAVLGTAICAELVWPYCEAFGW